MPGGRFSDDGRSTPIECVFVHPPSTDAGFIRIANLIWTYITVIFYFFRVEVVFFLSFTSEITNDCKAQNR